MHEDFGLTPAPADQERKNTKRRTAFAIAGAVGILVVCVAVILVVRRAPAVDNASDLPRDPTVTVASSPAASATPTGPAVSPTPGPWVTIADGLPKRDVFFSGITQCGEQLYLSGAVPSAEAFDNRIYALEDFRWVPLASYEAYVGTPLPQLSDVYTYDNMLFVDNQTQTHIMRADGSWFSLPRLETTADYYYYTQVADQSAADGLYAIAVTDGKIFRFENEAWVALPLLPAFDGSMAGFDDPWLTPELFAVGDELYVHYGATGDGGAVLYRLTAEGWGPVVGPEVFDRFVGFEGKLYIATRNDKLFRQDPEGWTNVTQSVIRGGAGERGYDFTVHDGVLYLDAWQNLYRLEGETWTPLMAGLPSVQPVGWGYLWSTDYGLLFGGLNHHFHRLGDAEWELLTGDPWDRNIYGIQSTNGMDFVEVFYDSMYLHRLHPDGTIESTTAIGMRGNRYCDIFSYRGGYIDEYSILLSRLYFNVNGHAIPLEDGLPLGNQKPIVYHEVGGAVYAVCEEWNDALYYLNGDRWQKVDCRVGTRANSLVVFQDALYVGGPDGIFRVAGGQVTPTQGAEPDTAPEFVVVGKTLYLTTGYGSFRLTDALTWQAILDAE